MRRVIAVAALLIGCLFGPPARAQIPLPPIPPLPPEVSLVLEYVAPVVSPVCGTAGFAVLIVQGVGAGVVDPTTFGYVFIVCGAVPVPDEPLTCAPDDQIQAVLDQIFFAAIGSESLVSGRLTGPVVEELLVLQDTLPPPLSDAGLAERVVGTLECHGIEAEPVPPPVGVPNGEPPAVDVGGPIEVPGEVIGFGSAPIGDLPLGVGASSQRAAAPRAGARPTQRLSPVPAVSIVGGRELSVLVFLLPLLLLAAGVVIGRGLLDDMDEVGSRTGSG